jgi:hypothetical protein
MRDVTDENVEPIDPHGPCLRPSKSFNACREQRPCASLPFEQFFQLVDHRRIRA